MQTRMMRMVAGSVLLLAWAGAVGAQTPGEAVRGLRAWLGVEAGKRPELGEQGWARAPLSKAEAEMVRGLLWAEHGKRIRAERAGEMKERKIREGTLEMPFFYAVFGEKPRGGRSLWISLHGGGGAPRQVNDQQWENQKRLYRPAEGVYLAPRAPTNTWNLWHEPHIDRMLVRLIENLIVFEDVDPNRVYLMGYSAGGDGVYQLAPRMADRFAAAAMMAGHPNDASPLGLRNLPFAVHVGALDGAYKRNQVAAEWGKKLDELQKADPQGYVHLTRLHEGKGHWMDRQDAEALPWMSKFTRNPAPAKVAWKQAGVTHRRFYYLAVGKEEQKAGSEVRAEYGGQKVTVEMKGVGKVVVGLSDAMMDLDKPVTVMVGGKEVWSGEAARTVEVMARTLEEYGDPAGVFCAEVECGGN